MNCDSRTRATNVTAYNCFLIFFVCSWIETNIYFTCIPPYYYKCIIFLFNFGESHFFFVLKLFSIQFNKSLLFPDSNFGHRYANDMQILHHILGAGVTEMATLITKLGFVLH